jgi:hypothetical protein
MPSQPAPSGRPPRKRSSPPVRPQTRELRPWQLAAFIGLGLVVAAVALGGNYVRTFHAEYGQYPWAKSAVPPKMYYDHRKYQHPDTAGLTGKEVQVGKSPGGGLILATTTAKKPAPTVIWVKDPKSQTVRRYSLVGGP